jgi:nucleotide-binding universal stress UspA family protein
MRNTPQHKTVLVGIDGSASSRSAIRLAVEEAGYRGAELIAVMAYSGECALRAPGGGPVSGLRTADDERGVAEAALRDTVADALGDQAAKVQLRTVLGLAGRNLIETAQDVNAQLIVLASRGSASMLLGTVSQYVLRKAPCPVLVVPEPMVTAPPAAAGHSPRARRR